MRPCHLPAGLGAAAGSSPSDRSESGSGDLAASAAAWLALKGSAGLAACARAAGTRAAQHEGRDRLQSGGLVKGRHLLWLSLQSGSVRHAAW